MAARSDDELVTALITRVTTLEHLIQTQQAELARLHTAVAQHAVLPTSATSEATGATSEDLAPPERPIPGRATRPSRRALLKLGGAAAAAGVAVVAAGASELGHASTAQAHADTFGFYQAISGAGNTAIRGDGGQGAHGVEGTTDYSYGVSGISLTGHAVHGESLQGGIGVIGISQSDSGIGTFGQGAQYGVRGESESIGVSGVGRIGIQGTGGNFGVYGQGNYGGVFTGHLAALVLGPASVPGAPNSEVHLAGELYVDSAGALWYCTSTGIAGTWVRLSGALNGFAGGAISYLSTPIRLLDARTSASSGLVNRGALAGNEVYTFGVAGLGGSGIPATAQGLIGNVTILGPSGTGNLSLFPAGGAVPTVASMTFGTAGLFLANGVNVAISSGGAINIQNQSSGTTPLVLDAVAFVS
jgi:hypothetical protein